jgi:hypothetical protein
VLQLAASAAPALLAAAPPRPARRKPVALIITEYRPNSHADVIGTRILEGYEYMGKKREPRLHAVSMFTDQVPWNDMSRDKAKKHNVTLYDTVRDALTLGGGKLAVEGVVIIGEHGNYPYNEKGQHLYPRYELFSQVVDVFKASGRSVPVFCDKHLSVDWTKASQMVDWSRELKFPLLAGSSLPVAWRRPALEFPVGVKMKRAVAAAYGGTEAYGFHALETLQCMAERRAGGETGIAAVQAIEGAKVWEWTDANAWSKPLLDAAVAASQTRKEGDMRANAKSPVLFVLEYKDGFQGAVYMLNGHINDFNFASEVEGRKGPPAAACFWLQPERFYAHFSGLTNFIEETIVTGRAPYPVERTLLTTGALAALMESAWRKGVRIETPQLLFSYAAPKRDYYNRGPVPAAEAKS